MKNLFRKYYQPAVSLFWALLVLCLPFTSSPIVAKLMGGTMVAVPSGIILFIFLIVWMLPRFWKGVEIPSHTLPLFLFLLIALISVVVGYWRDIPAFKGINPLKENIEAIITLIMGICFYLAAMLWLKEGESEKKIKQTLRLISYAGMLIFVKAFAEVLLWRSMGMYPDWFYSMHRLFVTGPLFDNRIAAFTYEPSWLANLLNLLFLPYWLASTVTRFSAFEKKLWKFQVEDICLVLGAATLFFTLSRLGYVSFLLMLGILFIRGTIWFTTWIQNKLQQKNSRLKEKTPQLLLRIGIYLVVVLVYLGLILGAGFALRSLDYRNEDIFNIQLEDFDLKGYAEDLAFGARLSYWLGGWNVFNKYPFLGAGLGNAGFHFADTLPDSAWKLIEVRQLFYRSNGVLNVKSLGFRILAETGILGFSAFLCFLLMIFVVITKLFREKRKLSILIGWMGAFTLAAFFIEQLSMDSFALPYFWISFGMVSAASTVSDKTDSSLKV